MFGVVFVVACPNRPATIFAAMSLLISRLACVCRREGGSSVSGSPAFSNMDEYEKQFE